MPENTEAHGKSIYGREHHFPKGSHAVGLDEVRGTTSRSLATRAEWSSIKDFLATPCRISMKTVAAACVNVDLVQSTKDCLRYLYPLTPQGGVIFSQDAHFPWIIELLSDDAFWEKEIGIKKPAMEGLGYAKLVTIPRL